MDWFLYGNGLSHERVNDVAFLNVAGVFSLLKVKLNLKICIRQKPLFIFVS